MYRLKENKQSNSLLQGFHKDKNLKNWLNKNRFGFEPIMTNMTTSTLPFKEKLYGTRIANLIANLMQTFENLLLQNYWTEYLEIAHK